MTVCFKAFTTKSKSQNYSSAVSSNFSYKPEGAWKRQNSGLVVPSTDFYSEINSATLKHLYTSNLDEMIEANRRLQLYFRVAKINVDSQMGTIFIKKYNNFYPYF
jgi:predicted metalloendopeptidase